MMIVAIAGGLSGYASAAAAEALTYETPQGVTFVVTADGLSSIRYAGREIAAGGWRAGSGEDWFRYGAGKVAADKITEKSLEIWPPTAPACGTSCRTSPPTTATCSTART